MKLFNPDVMEKLAGSNDHANFIQNSLEMPSLNRYSNIVTNKMNSGYF